MNLDCHYRTSRMAFSLVGLSFFFIVSFCLFFAGGVGRTSSDDVFLVGMVAPVVFSGGLLLVCCLRFFNERIIISPDGITWIDKMGRVKMAIEASRILPYSYRGQLLGPPMPSQLFPGRCKVETEVGFINFDEKIANYYFLCRACAQFAGQGV